MLKTVFTKTKGAGETAIFVVGLAVVTGPMVDQAALRGLLKRVRDLGMPLISAIRVKPG